MKDQIGKIVEINELQGQIFTRVYRDDVQNSLIFENEEIKYVFFHDQECCEYVYIESINGDLSDLENTQLLSAESRTSEDNKLENSEDCFQWTFYSFATIKGYIDVRWYGSSNCYYSVGVTIKKYILK